MLVVGVWTLTFEGEVGVCMRYFNLIIMFFFVLAILRSLHFLVFVMILFVKVVQDFLYYSMLKWFTG